MSLSKNSLWSKGLHVNSLYIPGDKNSTRLLVITSEIWKGRVILLKALVLQDECIGKNAQGSHTTYYSLMSFIAYTFKGQVHVFAGQVKIVSHSSCRIFAPCIQSMFYIVT